MNDRKTPDSNDLDESTLDRKQNALKIAFYWAASDGDTKMLRELLIAGAKDEWCGGALLRSSENGRTEATKFLLATVDSMGMARLAFRMAAAKEHIDTVKAIVDWIGEKQKSTAHTAAPSV
jgi:hypothetical protein